MSLLVLRFTLKTNCPEEALSSLINEGIPFFKPRREEEGISFTANIFARRAVCHWAKKQNYVINARYEGIISRFFVLKHRLGVIFGTIISIFLIYLSTFYVWSVRIEGNESLSDSEITELLRECGFSEGVKKADVDVNEIQNTALTRCHELSFLSINIHGMVADVVVHERVTSPKAIDPYTPYNLVADTDGVIVSSVVLDGQALFSRGDTVYKGQLLVSGLVDSTSGISTVHHARGKVYARTNRTLTFEIPLTRVEKRQTATEEIRGVRILGKSFYKKPKDLTGSFDITTDEEEIRFMGLLLPITEEIRRVSYYVEESVTLSRDEAEALALEEYGRFLSTELDSAEILGEDFSFEEKSNSVILTAEVCAIENIATEKKFTVE